MPGTSILMPMSNGQMNGKTIDHVEPPVLDDFFQPRPVAHKSVCKCAWSVRKKVSLYQSLLPPRYHAELAARHTAGDKAMSRDDPSIARRTGCTASCMIPHSRCLLGWMRLSHSCQSNVLSPGARSRARSLMSLHRSLSSFLHCRVRHVPRAEKGR